MKREDIIRNLLDAGCDESAVEQFMELYDKGNTAQAHKLLMEHRKELLSDIHAEEEKIRCLDYLLFEMDRQEIL